MLFILQPGIALLIAANIHYYNNIKYIIANAEKCFTLCYQHILEVSLKIRNLKMLRIFLYTTVSIDTKLKVFTLFNFFRGLYALKVYESTVNAGMSSRSCLKDEMAK